MHGLGLWDYARFCRGYGITGSAAGVWRVGNSPSTVHNFDLKSFEERENTLGWAESLCFDRRRLQGVKRPLLHREICLHVHVGGGSAFMT